MPILQRVADAYRERGVRLYAVNVGEDREKIERFLSKHSLDLTIVMDEDRDICRELGITGLPTTLVIDRERRVHTMHVGFTENLEERLRAEIEALLERDSP